MEPNMRIDSHCSYACRVYRPNISSFFVLRHDIFFNTCPLPLPPRPSCTRPFKWLPFDYLSKAAHVASGARVWYENNSIFSFVMRGAGFCHFFFFFLVSGVASNLPMFYASFFQNVTSRHLNLTLASMDRPTFTVDYGLFNVWNTKMAQVGHDDISEKMSLCWALESWCHLQRDPSARCTPLQLIRYSDVVAIADFVSFQFKLDRKGIKVSSLRSTGRFKHLVLTLESQFFGADPQLAYSNEKGGLFS